MNFEGDFTLTIDGAGAAGASSFDVLNPANESVVARAPDASREQLDLAVAAARKAFPSWAATPIAERKAMVGALAGAIAQHVEPLKRLLTGEQGKPHADAFNDIMGGAAWLQAACSLDLPETVNEDNAQRRSITRHVPIGVVGAIAPWNFPVLLAMFKLGPALIAGNTVVLKPSPFTPLTTLKIGELARGIFPPGVLNVLSGGDSLGPWMTSHPGIDKISFTGSSATGRKVMQSASATLKRITLELGGNDAAIVLPDVDVAKLAEPLFWAAFRNTGQICIASKRLYIHKDVYEPLKRALCDYAATVKMGDGAEQGTQLGPIQNRQQYQRVQDLLRDSRERGYGVTQVGRAPEGHGYFVPVTLVDNPPEDARIVREEQFGPVLPLLKVDSTEEAIARANASEYGLGASVWSADTDKALAIGKQLQAGTVWINDTQYLTPLASFAGHKQSGIGVENGLEGLLEYTNSQTIVVRKS
jgi:aldehyde dehydrogenase (NAD+)